MTREEVKQICQIYDNLRRERDAATIVYNSDDTFWDHILITYNLSQPSLPSDIDEAELKYVESMDNPPANQEEERIIYQTFKAGAEWLAKQGHSQEEIVEDKTLELGYGTLSGIDPIINLSDSFKPGDKVIVQVRKK